MSPHRLPETPILPPAAPAGAGVDAVVAAQRDFDIELFLLLEAIRLKFNHDFRNYALASLRRRVRQALSALGLRTPSALQDRLLREPAIFSTLMGYLTVQVSDLFRDPSYFRAVREHVVPLLRTYPAPRIWVAGCGDGEEAYSLAILLDEEGLLERSQIYATDVAPAALRRAASGVFAIDRVPGFTDRHRAAGLERPLDEHYVSAYGGVLFSQRLRSRIVFSEHSLATDSVFAEVQLVSCRNVLIYFNRALQDRAIGLFREALCERGFLGLGAKESVRFSAHAKAFEDVDREQRIYRRRPS